MAKKEKNVEIPDLEERIVKAAITVFARTPFPYADLRSVAREAGVEMAEIKKRFSLPEDLYRVVLDRVMMIHRKEAMPSYMAWKAKGSIHCDQQSAENGRAFRIPPRHNRGSVRSFMPSST